MADIIFPTSSAPGMKPQESGGRLINAFVEETPVGAPSQIVIRRSAGLEYLTQAVGFTHTRAFLDCGGSILLWIVDERVFAVDSNYALTNLGALVGTDPVTVARNNKSPTPDNVAVTALGCFNLFTGGAPTAFADADLPASPTSVCFFEGYFIWSYGSGLIFASDFNAVTVNALSFNTEQGLFVRRVVSFGGRLFAFGDKWTGVYRNAGTSPFPLAREATIPVGIVGTHAIAGWEHGWANVLIWAGANFNVYKLEGYTPVLISTNEVSRAIETAVKAGQRNLIEAYVYMQGRNAFWTLNCHGLWTWEYNLSTGRWNERQSHDSNHWKGMQTIFMFDEWLIGDMESKLSRMNEEYFAEGDDPLEWIVESGVMHGFPVRTVIPRAAFNITAAVGSVPITIDPKVLISWSLDGGYTWSQPVQRRLGGPGDSKSYPSVIRSGISRGQGVRYRLVVTDPVHVALYGGVIDAQPRGVKG